MAEALNRTIVMQEEQFNKVGCDLEKAACIVRIVAERLSDSAEDSEKCALLGALDILQGATAVLEEHGKIQ